MRYSDLSTDSLLGSYRCSNDTSDLAVFDDLQHVALQRTHLHHLVQVVFEHIQVEKANVVAGDVEPSRAPEVDRGSRRRSQRLVPEMFELQTARIRVLAAIGSLEDLLGRNLNH